jgi:hypothetical protein
MHLSLRKTIIVLLPDMVDMIVILIIFGTSEIRSLFNALRCAYNPVWGFTQAKFVGEE